MSSINSNPPEPNDGRRLHGRVVAGTPEARELASSGGRASALAARQREAARELDEAIVALVAAAPSLTQRQRDAIRAVFCTGPSGGAA